MTMQAQTSYEFQGFELNISHSPAAHCENGAISSLLRFYGFDLSEPMIFGLASGLFFTHLTFVKGIVLRCPAVALDHVVTAFAIDGIVLVAHDGVLAVFQVLWNFLDFHTTVSIL